jgi:hypothetical protein
VPLHQASWLAVVAICALAALLLLINDYTGYSIITVAVGLAAAVNLLPSPYSDLGRSSEPSPLDAPPPEPASPEPSPEEAGSDEGPRNDVSGST